MTDTSDRPFYITTPIYYVNAEPHIGHAYSSITADALCRWNKLLSGEARLLTGSDEHGLKIQRSAAAAGRSPREHADITSSTFRTLWDRLNIDYDDYIRTTEPRHHLAVQDLLSRVKSNGFIYDGTYEGLYCVACEGYYNESDLESGLCPIHKRPAEWMSERNWFFRLSNFTPNLRDWLSQQTGTVVPDSRRQEAMALVESGLEDVSITRSSISWGVQVPWDPSQVFYVWYDALINYVTGIGYPEDTATFEHWWPNSNHLIAKDIIRFHCIYWPAMLMAAGIDPPKRVIVTGFLNTNGEKVSKSGPKRATTPDDFIKLVGVDGLRHHLLHDVSLGNDTEFSTERVVGRYNSDLANTLGNTVARITKLVTSRAGDVPLRPDPESDLKPLTRRIVREVEMAWSVPAPGRALDLVWSLIANINSYIEREEPWRKRPGPEVDTVLGNALEMLRIVSVLVWPAIPSTAESIWGRIGMSGSPADELVGTSCRWGRYDPSMPVTLGEPLFPRVAVPGIA